MLADGGDGVRLHFYGISHIPNGPTRIKDAVIGLLHLFGAVEFFCVDSKPVIQRLLCCCRRLNSLPQQRVLGLVLGHKAAKVGGGRLNAGAFQSISAPQADNTPRHLTAHELDEIKRKYRALAREAKKEAA